MAKSEAAQAGAQSGAQAGPATAPITELVFPLSRFATKLVDTKDEVWLGVLRQFHGTEKHTVAGWKKIIDSYRNKPAHSFKGE